MKLIDKKKKRLLLYRNKLLHIYGLNGSGKTSLLKKTSSTLFKNDINHYLHYLAILEKHNKINDLLNELFWVEKKIFIDLSKQLGVTIRGRNKLINQLSSGEKKKIYLSLLLSRKEGFWLVDEPISYLDSLSYALFLHKMRKHISTGGFLILTTNIVENTSINNYISLSRFELLTTRLSSDCSTTEL